MSPNRWRCLAAMLLSVCVTAPASAALAMGCTSEGAVVRVPKGYSIAEVDFQQLPDAPPVRATVWSERLGPRTVGSTLEALPKGVWTPVPLLNVPEYQVNGDKDWRMGVSALYADTAGSGDFSRSFDCVDRELHANGADPWGWYLLSFIPHESSPGVQAFQARVRLQRGPIRPPKPPRPDHNQNHNHH